MVSEGCGLALIEDVTDLDAGRIAAAIVLGPAILTYHDFEPILRLFCPF